MTAEKWPQLEVFREDRGKLAPGGLHVEKMVILRIEPVLKYEESLAFRVKQFPNPSHVMLIPSWMPANDVKPTKAVNSDVEHAEFEQAFMPSSDTGDALGRPPNPTISRLLGAVANEP